eukprot:sb/3465846/
MESCLSGNSSLTGTTMSTFTFLFSQTSYCYLVMTAFFKVPRHRSSASKPVNFNSIEVGRFSLTHITREYCPDVSVPKMKKVVKLPADLNEGFEDFEERVMGGNDCVFKWICGNEFDMESIDLIASRGILKKIATNPYDHFRNHFGIRLVKIADTIAMDTLDTAEEEMTTSQLRNMYHGHRLEKVTMDVGENESNIVTTCNIAGYRCLVRAEVDGCNDEGELVEVKANFVIQYPKQLENFRRGKLFTTFMQCYLVGIPNVLIGFRDKSGILRRVQNYTLPQIEEECKAYWNKDFYMAFLNAVLSWALPQIAEGKVYHLEYKGGDEIALIEVPDPDHIPQFFKDYVQQKSSGSYGGSSWKPYTVAHNFRYL